MLIELIILAVLFAASVYAAWWVCQHFQMPQPVYWIVGAIFLIILLLGVVQRLGIKLP